MAEELPILKGILKGNFSYHNARKCKHYFQVSKYFKIFWNTSTIRLIIHCALVVNSKTDICIEICGENSNEHFKGKKNKNQSFRAVHDGLWIYGSWTTIQFMPFCNEIKKKHIHRVKDSKIYYWCIWSVYGAHMVSIHSLTWFNVVSNI